MKKKVKTEINLQIEEAVAIRPQRVLCSYCPRCRKERQMIAPNEAARVAALTAREVYRLVESDRLHFVEDQQGLLFVCVDSLIQLMIRGSSDP